MFLKFESIYFYHCYHTQKIVKNVIVKNPTFSRLLKKKKLCSSKYLNSLNVKKKQTQYRNPLLCSSTLFSKKDKSRSKLRECSANDGDRGCCGSVHKSSTAVWIIPIVVHWCAWLSYHEWNTFLLKQPYCDLYSKEARKIGCLQTCFNSVGNWKCSVFVENAQSASQRAFKNDDCEEETGAIIILLNTIVVIEHRRWLVNIS